MKEKIVEQRQKPENRGYVERREEKNIIIYKVRGMERTPFNGKKVKDQTLVTKLMDQLKRGDIDVKSMIRLGKLHPKKHKEGKTRPISLNLYEKMPRQCHAKRVAPRQEPNGKTTTTSKH